MVGATDELIDAKRARELQESAVREDIVLVWTVYQHPRDFPDRYIARPYRCTPCVKPLPEHLEGLTLEALRSQIPPTLVRLDRSKYDDPKIVETWQ